MYVDQRTQHSLEPVLISLPRGCDAGELVYQDVGAVLNHSAEEAGARNLDLSRVVFVGHSAGGHLAL